MPAITLLGDDEESGLFEAYDASSAKEHAAASRLLNPHHGLSDPAYMKLLGDLRIVRMESKGDMLAIIAYCKKKREFLAMCSQLGRR